MKASDPKAPRSLANAPTQATDAMRPIVDQLEPRLMMSATVLVNETFEGAFPGNFSYGHNGGQTASGWGDNNYRAHGGSWSAFCADNGTNNRSVYDNNTNAYLRRDFNLAGYAGANLEFWAWVNTTNASDHLDVHVWNAGNTTWDTLGTLSGNQSSSGWQKITVPLTAYASQPTVSIYFGFVSDATLVPASPSGAWIDDVVVTGYTDNDMFEPNNTLATANNWGVRDTPFGYIGLVGSGYDYYKVTTLMAGRSQDNVTITYDAAQGHSFLYLYDSGGSMLTYDTSTDGSNTVSLNGRPAGTYTVLVYTPPGAINPSYQVNVNVPTDDDVYESNDTSATATDLGTLTSTFTASNLIADNNGDWYRFTTVMTGRSSDAINLSFTHALGDVDMRLYAASDLVTPVAGSYNMGNNEQIPLDGLAAGTYYLKVYGCYSDSMNPNYSMTIAPPRDNDVYESNNTSATATNLGTLISTFTAGNLMADNNGDWYRFTTSATGRANDAIDLSFAHALGDVDMLLYASSDLATPIAGSYSVGNSEHISLSGLAAGTYYLNLYVCINSLLNPNYSMTIAPPRDDDAYESNNTSATATNLGSLTGTFHRDNLMADGLSDWYRFTTMAAGGASDGVDLAFAHSLGDVDMRLYAASDLGNWIASSTGTANTEHVSLTGRPAGTYYVQVYSVGAGSLNPNYSLNIKTPAPAITINDVSVTEGNSGQQNMVFTVSLSGACSNTVTVNYHTREQTAHAGSDYQSIGGQLTFAPGQLSRTIIVPIMGDLVPEVNETVAIDLWTATNATIARASATGTIVNGADAWGDIINFGNGIKGVYFDEAGNAVTITLNGGTGEIRRVSAGLCDAGDIILTGTDDKSTLTFSVKGTSKTTKIGYISCAGAMKSITGSGVNLVRDGLSVSGFVGTVKLGDVLNGGDVRLGGAPEQSTALTVHAIGNEAAVDSGARLKTFTMASMGSGGLITAPTIGTFAVKGDAKTADVGNMLSPVALSAQDAKGISLGSLNAAGLVGNYLGMPGSSGALAVGAWEDMLIEALDIKSISTKGTKDGVVDSQANVSARNVGAVSIAGNLRGNWQAQTVKSIAVSQNVSDLGLNLLASGVTALGSFKVVGAMERCNVTSAGNVGDISVGAVSDSQVFAGGITPVVGAGGETELPQVSAFDMGRRASIKSIKVTGKALIGGFAFDNSKFAAADIGTVSLAFANSATPNPSGLAADMIKKYSYKDASGTKTFSNLDDPTETITDGNTVVRIV